MFVAPDPVIAADAALGLNAIDIQRLAGPARVTVRLFSRPQVRPEQPAQLALGNVTALAARRTLATQPLDFELPDALGVPKAMIVGSILASVNHRSRRWECGWTQIANTRHCEGSG
jgi:hypothetical protein